jgi:hypothetical protein
MAKIYCKKCGLRGDSKCPNCRHVFADNNPNDKIGSQEFLETFLHVRKWDKEQTPSQHDGSQRWLVGVWTYALTDQDALTISLQRLQEVLTDPNVNITVAACAHDWKLMPGQKSDIGCGCVGPENDNVPADPYKR